MKLNDMKDYYQYIVGITTDSEEDTILYEGQSLQDAQHLFNSHIFSPGEWRLYLDRYNVSYAYKGQKNPEIDPVPTNLFEKYS